MIERITDRIYYMKHSEETDRPALGLVIGDDCCLVVDSGNSPRHAKEFQKEIEALKVPPVKYLVLTHYHWDHILGLSDWDAVVIAHQATEEYIAKYRNMKYDDEALELAKSRGIFGDAAIKSIQAEMEDRENYHVGKIHAFYNDSMKIDLGNVTCVIRHIDSPHTEDTSIIYVPEAKTMFLGDCIYGCTKDGFNYYDDKKLFCMIDAIEEHDSQYYLCSHESLCPRTEIEDFWNNLRMSYEAAKKGLNLQEAMEEYRKATQTEPTDEIEFFIKSFGSR